MTLTPKTKLYNWQSVHSESRNCVLPELVEVYKYFARGANFEQEMNLDLNFKI
jgi:hypothetical protein